MINRWLDFGAVRLRRGDDKMGRRIVDVAGDDTYETFVSNEEEYNLKGVRI